MHNFINKKVLITTSNWFVAPDGKEYCSVHGTLKAVHEAGKALGFIPNRSHANWFIEVGNMTIMGCQVMYLIACDEVNEGEAGAWINDEKEGGVKKYNRPSKIYVTE